MPERLGNSGLWRLPEGRGWELDRRCPSFRGLGAYPFANVAANAGGWFFTSTGRIREPDSSPLVRTRNPRVRGYPALAPATHSIRETHFEAAVAFNRRNSRSISATTNAPAIVSRFNGAGYFSTTLATNCSGHHPSLPAQVFV